MASPLRLYARIPSTPYGPGLYLQFVTIQNSGTYTMQDGTPLPSADQNVYIAASGPHPRMPNGFFNVAAPYTFSSVAFLSPANFLNNSPESNDCDNNEGGFSPGLECTLESEINTGIANALPPGVYHASYTINVSNTLTGDIPQPEPLTVFIDLVVTAHSDCDFGAESD